MKPSMGLLTEDQLLAEFTSSLFCELWFMLPGLFGSFSEVETHCFGWLDVWSAWENNYLENSWFACCVALWSVARFWERNKLPSLRKQVYNKELTSK